MPNNVCCPKCQNKNVRSVDNQPLNHPSKREVEQGVPNWDNELYVTFICDQCNPMAVSDKYFTLIFNLVPQQ
jgi:hypothetical protein